MIHSRGPSSLGALQRELQEERIKEEILVRRLNQRRMIEEQLRHDLAIIGRRSLLPFHGPVPVLQPQPLMVLPPPPPVFRYAAASSPPPVREEIADFDSRSMVVPLQEEVQEEEESPKAVRIKKRKAIEANKEESPKAARIKKKKKAAEADPKEARNKEWGCALCMVSATNEEGLRDHLRGKKHQARAAAELASGNVGKAKVKAKAKKMAVDEEKANEEVIDEAPADEERKGKKTARIVVDGRSQWVVERRNHLFCEACGVRCYSKEVMISHLSGKKHQQLANSRT